jgi:hypothetical protein
MVTTMRPCVMFEPKQLFPLRLSRIMDHELQFISPYAAKIERDPFCDAGLDQNETLVLPKLFTALESLFGPSSTGFDSWKCSFLFTLLLSGRRGETPFNYILSIRDWRAGVEFSYWRLQQDPVAAGARVAPVHDELSSSNLDYVTALLFGYLLGHAEKLGQLEPRTFVRQVRSQLLVCGARDGQLFEEHAEDGQAYDQRCLQLSRELDDVERQQQRIQLDLFLEELAFQEPGTCLDDRPLHARPVS